MPTDEALLYLWTCPGSADFGVVTPEEFGERIGELKELPENLRRSLASDESAERIQRLVLKKHRLSLEQAQTVARVLGSILRGEESSANLLAFLRERVDAPAAVLDDMVQTLTKQFITPNYFQIAQVYEKKQKTKGVGSRVSGVGDATGVGSRVSGVGHEWTTTPEPPRATPPVSPRATPPRVIDLRNGAIPSRLPPPPPVAPLGGTSTTKPSVPPGTPLERLAPPSSPTPPSSL